MRSTNPPLSRKELEEEIDQLVRYAKAVLNAAKQPDVERFKFALCELEVLVDFHEGRVVSVNGEVISVN